MEQRSQAWYEARLGKVTASGVTNIMGSKTKAEGYMLQLIAERLTGNAHEIPITPAMQHGMDTEDEARKVYERKFSPVSQVGFVDHPTIPMSGCSPDGIIYGDRNGLIEIKCPQPKAHTDILLTKKIPQQYIHQIMWQLSSCGEDKEYVDFVSYNPSFPDDLKMIVIRKPRDNDYWIPMLEEKVKAFLTEVENKIKQIKEL